ncbi:MAG: hypothetical protein ACLVKO_09255 [Dysgonomonas sp.]
MKEDALYTSDLTEDTACDLIIGLWEITESAKKIESILFDVAKQPLNPD